MSYSVDVMSVAIREPITLPATEREQVREFERMLDLGAPALVSASGERIVVPPTVYEVLRKIVELMAEGKAVTLVPDNQVVTTQRAADLLGMSRPFFIKLLETGAMAHHRVGNQRRVYLRDVLEFARRRDEEREAALDRLSRQAFEAGLYDRNVMPEDGSDE
jgi:excisionase family DNA binding protein